MNKELYNKMKPFEDQMMKASVAGWVRMTRQQLDKYAPLYTEATGKVLSLSQKACPRCVLNALREGWKVYEAYKKRYVKDDGKEPEEK